MLVTAAVLIHVSAGGVTGSHIFIPAAATVHFHVETCPCATTWMTAVAKAVSLQYDAPAALMKCTAVAAADQFHDDDTGHVAVRFPAPLAVSVQCATVVPMKCGCAAAVADQFQFDGFGVGLTLIEADVMAVHCHVAAAAPN